MSTFWSASGEDDCLSGLTATFISLHNGSPGTTGANEISGGSYIRVATTWGSPSAGAMVGSQVAINVPAATTVDHFGIWTASTSGTYKAGGNLPNSELFTGAGVYDCTPTVTATG